MVLDSVLSSFGWVYCLARLLNSIHDNKLTSKKLTLHWQKIQKSFYKRHIDTKDDDRWKWLERWNGDENGSC